jgi:predicted RNA polymerase sigma factor
LQRIAPALWISAGPVRAVRADLLLRLESPEEAVAEYDLAIGRAENEVEREFPERRRDTARRRAGLEE